MNSYRVYLKGCKSADSTIKNYTYHINNFVSTVSTDWVHNIDFDWINSLFSVYYGTKSGMSPSYQMVLLSAFRKFVDMLGMDSRKVVFNVPKKVRSGVKALTEEQLNCILTGIGDSQGFMECRDKAMFAMFGYLGLRLAELQNIKIDDIDFDNNKIKVLGKGNRIGYVPLIKVVKPYLLSWMEKREGVYQDCSFWITQDGRELGKRAIQVRMSKYVKQFNPNNSTHTLRHTAATMLINKGVDIKTISTLLRHTSIKTTADTYAHQSVEAVGNKMNGIYGG